MTAEQYNYAPGQELQPETSTHEEILGGKRRKLQAASAVLGYSRSTFPSRP